MITCNNAFNMWPETNPLLPVLCGDTKRLDTLLEFFYSQFWDSVLQGLEEGHET